MKKNIQIKALTSMSMKSKINSIVISSLFVFAVFAGIPKAFENAFAQEGAITPEGTVNDTMSGENATQWANATLVFAQEGFTTEDLVNETKQRMMEITKKKKETTNRI